MIPVRLEAENFFSYDRLELDFDFSSALIVGDNGSGKSTILQSIAWALYGKSRYKHADDVVKRGRKVAKVLLVFEHDGERYKVIRKRHSKYASQNSLELYHIVNGKEEQIKEDTNSLLDAKIREIVKSNYDVFINSSYFKQGSISDFLYGTSATRQKLLSSILNLDRWDKYMDLASKESKEIDKELALLKYKLKDLENVESDIATCESDIDAKQEKIVDLASKDALLAESINTIEVKISNIRANSQALSQYQDNVNNYEHACSKLNELISVKKDRETTLSKASKDREVNQKAIIEIDTQIEKILPNLELKDKIQGLQEKESKLHLLKVELAQCNSQVQNLQTSDKCLACGHAHTDPVKKQIEIEKIQEKANELSVRIEKGERVVNKLREYQKTVSQTELEIDKYISRKRNIENNIRLHDLKIESMSSEIQLINKSIADCTKQRDKLKVLISKNKEIGGNKNLDELRQQLKVRKKEQQEVSIERDELLYTVGALNQRLDKLYKDKEVKSEVSTKVDELNKKSVVYSNLVRGFSRNGIQAIIVDNVVEELAKVTNDQLSQFTSSPAYVEFITQKKDSKNSWKETLDINIRTASGISEFEGLSGGEGFRVAFAIRLALSHIQARRMGGETQLLMLDEVSTSLDPHGLECFVSIIRKLEKNMKIMVITHDDKLKEEFEHIIHVVKQGDNSFIDN